MGRIEARMRETGIEFPPDWTPRGNFLPYRRHGALVFLSGQICEWDGEVTCEGPVGPSADAIATARAAARVCALNLLARLRQACDGDLDRVASIQRLGGFVNGVPGFPASPAVIDGATEVFATLWGDDGLHARTAVAVSGLPGNAAVEVDAVVALKAD